MAFIKKLDELNRGDLAIAGGKGANLGALIQAGMSVPPGFVVTTEGYRAFLTANALGDAIQQVLESTRFDDPASLDAASAQIRQSFHSGKIPPDLTDEILVAYSAFNRQSAAGEMLRISLKKPPTPVAVRSSATAEDLPDLSFAGQQDTYLNIVGETAVLDAVVRCWASLWTARAIGYRARNGIAHDAVALAVVVQQMVQSEASGVLFTANPLTGKRAETVIDATFGLGEALVSGQVEPDHYVVNDGQIVSKTLGAKALAIRGQVGGGTETIQADASQQQALPDEQILALAQLGHQAEAYFSSPQDMEWAFSDGALYVVQSRAITSLYPMPEGMPAEPLQVMVAFGAVQGLLDPITPFGRDGISALAASVSNLLGYPATAETQRAFWTAGERIYSNITPLLRNRIGRDLVPRVLGAIEPGSQGFIIRNLLNDPRLAPAGHAPIRFSTAWKLLRKLIPTILRMIRTLLAPEHARISIFKDVEAFCEWVEVSGRNADGHEANALQKRLDWLDMIYTRLPRFMLERMIPTFAPGIAMWNVLNDLAADIPNGSQLAMEVTRGLPFNVTTEMDLALWETARAIQKDAASLDAVQQRDASVLAADYQAGRLPETAQTAVQRFLTRYGMRGVAEIDIGRTRWGEDPTPVFQALKSYSQITNPDLAPDAIFRRSAQAAEEAVEALALAARAMPHGGLKAMRIHWAAKRVRALSGLRELPKFMAIRVMGMVRIQLLQSGAELVAAGALQRPEHIFFLHLKELRELARNFPSLSALPESEKTKVKALVAERLLANQREQRRRQSPRLLLSDGRAIYEGVQTLDSSEGDHILTGSPVSPGTVEGIVHVVFDPHLEQLAPGEILVCPGTDPAWTPLFLAAGGLVMEVGGLMTHGSVVAREYGIPAVVGVSNATGRLKNGQRIKVDGNTGKVVILL